jgi:hypothetical protein
MEGILRHVVWVVGGGRRGERMVVEGRVSRFKLLNGSVVWWRIEVDVN